LISAYHEATVFHPKERVIVNMNNSARARSEQGSMLSMTALTFGIIMFACVIAFAFYLLLSQQKRGQHETDKIAMDLAKVLNKDDRVGQINNVIARCRELVYVSRENVVRASEKGYNHLLPLANQLVEESRSSAVLVESERENQKGMSISDVKVMIENYNLKARPDSSFKLPWFESYDPAVYDVKLGYVDKVESNVENLQVIPELRDFDQTNGYIQKGSNLYKGNINARLPNPDSDLDFKLSSLPTTVEQTVAPPRLVNADVFRPAAVLFTDKEFRLGKKMDQLPSAAEVLSRMDVSITKTDRQSVQIGSVAQTSGALPAP